MNINQKGITFLTAVIIVAFLLGATGCTVVKQQENKKADSAATTSDWKTYADANMGVSVKYPSSWTYQEFSCNLAGVAFCPLAGNSLLNCKQTCGMDSPASPIYLYNNGNKTAKTNLELKSTDYEYKKIYDQMLSTLKFTTPTAVQLPKAISSIVENKLSVWVTQWKNITPNFNLASFSKENESTISSGYKINPCDAKCSSIFDDMKNLYAFSPNGEKFIDVHGGQMIEVKNGKHVFVSGEPDSSVLVIDKKLQTIQTVLFCGTPCGFSNAAWIDNNSLVVVGEESISDTEGINYKGQVATLYVINLATQKVELYKWPTTAEQVR